MFEAFHCFVKNKIRFRANYWEKRLKLVLCIDNVNDSNVHLNVLSSYYVIFLSMLSAISAYQSSAECSLYSFDV